jgi:hypothetical protein
VQVCKVANWVSKLVKYADDMYNKDQEHIPFNYMFRVATGRSRCKFCHKIIAKGNVEVAVNDPRRGDWYFAKHLNCSSKTTLAYVAHKYTRLECVPGWEDLNDSQRSAISRVSNSEI